ncbi:hypothetical protein AAMO2058_000408200 [Amorphochlora amoebiformis]
MEEAMDPQNSEPRRYPASLNELNNLVTVKLGAKSSRVGEMCAVCREDFREDDECTVMACDHAFHKACLSPWLALHNTCPKCRYPLMTDDAEQNRSVVELRHQLEVQRQYAEDRKARAANPQHYINFATNHRLSRSHAILGMIPVGNRTLRLPSSASSNRLGIHSSSYTLG